MDRMLTEEQIVMSQDLALRWPIFVVSLKDAIERRSQILAQCTILGLQPELVDAIDGRDGLPPEVEHLVDRNTAETRVGRKLTDGEYACALSHRTVYQRICREGLPGAIILEDDAILTEYFADFLAGKGYLEADLVQMDHLDARVWHRKGRAWSERITVFPLAENASLTSGYSLSARAARYLLDHSSPLAGLADWPCDTMPLSPLATLPRVVEHPKTDSATSTLKTEREISRHAQSKATEPRWKRFFRQSYWARWWFKRRTKKIS